MSLISEALRKAQLEAVRQDRDERRYYMSHGGRSQNASSGNRTVALIAILGGLCFLAGAALFYMSTRSVPGAPVVLHQSAVRGSVPSPVTTTAAPAVTDPAPAPAPAVAEPARRERSTPVPAKNEKSRVQREKRAVTPAAENERIERPRTPRAEPEVVRETPARSASIVIGDPRRAPATRRNSRDGFVQGETYGSPVLGPFGTEVTLTGITSLGGQFVAIINGSTVRAGSAVGPFIIEEIDARRVRLRYVDISFFVVQ